MRPYDTARRKLIQALGALALAPALDAVAWAAGRSDRPLGRVLIIGGGFAGASAAKYLRKWSQGRIQVVLIERNPEFLSCPTSNEVLVGYRPFSDLRHSFDALRRNWGVQVVHAQATAVDPVARTVQTDRAGTFVYDRLIVAPGIDFDFDQIQGLDAAAREKVLHAWKAGPQTLALRRQLEDLPDGGVYALSVPKAPYRCPPGPYERASLIASWFKKTRPRAKVIVLDANEKIMSKEKLFQAAWQSDYQDILEYHPNWKVTEIDAGTKTLVSELGDRLQADVLNVLPPQRAGGIAHVAGLVSANRHWAPIDWVTFEATAAHGIHVLGDAVELAPGMPKSATMASSQGKAAAAAIVQILTGQVVAPQVLVNTCYSLVDERHAMHVSSVHRYDPEKKVHLPVPGAGGLSHEATELERLYARAWARTIWADVLG